MMSETYGHDAAAAQGLRELGFTAGNIVPEGGVVRGVSALVLLGEVATRSYTEHGSLQEALKLNDLGKRFHTDRTRAVASASPGFSGSYRQARR